MWTDARDAASTRCCLSLKVVELTGVIGSQVVCDPEQLTQYGTGQLLPELLVQRGVLVFKGVFHRAIAYPLDSARLMHRATLIGEEAFS